MKENDNKPAVRKRAEVMRKLCVACGCCARVCPTSAVAVHRGMYACVNADSCVGCGKCASSCPASVIDMKEVTA